MPPTPPLDLSLPASIQTYLSQTPFASHSITPLSGGYGNFTFRLHLVEGATLVFKHGKSFLPGDESFPFDLSRQKFEVEAMRWVRTCQWSSPSPSSFTVSVPKIHLFDEEAHVIIMDDCGSSSTTLKQFILSGRCSTNPSSASSIGSTLGSFLAQLHVRGSGSAPEMRGMFGANVQAKEISAWATYGRLVSTLSGEDALPALDPPLEIGKAELERVGAFALEAQAAIISASDYVVMGDFWPGNILLTEADGPLALVDWELAKTGLPGHDLGQFIAEIHLIRAFHPSFSGVCSDIIDAFVEDYARERGWATLVEGDPALSRDMLAHQAAHLIAWTPRIPWGDKQTTRAVVLEGYELLNKCISSPKDTVQ